MVKLRRTPFDLHSPLSFKMTHLSMPFPLCGLGDGSGFSGAKMNNDKLIISRKALKETGKWIVFHNYSLAQQMDNMDSIDLGKTLMMQNNEVGSNQVYLGVDLNACRGDTLKMNQGKAS